jgi:polyhydroxybutyrate depolymerase
MMMKINHKFLAVLSLLILMTLACARTSRPVPDESLSLPAGKTTRTLIHNGLDRSYILYVPTSINWDAPVPLVFVFHGGTGNAQSAIVMSGFNDVADQNGFMLAYPNGAGRLSDDKLLTWNSGDCCGYAQEKNMDDVGFVRAIVAELESMVDIDAKHIFATGLSNGAMLSQRLACEAADIFAAVAPVAGTLNFPQCQPSQPVSVIEFHGTADQHVLYDGGRGPDALVDVDFVSVQDSVEFWVTANECTTQAQTNSFDDIRHEVWVGCEAGTAVELYIIIDGGHAWPGGGSGWPGSDKPTQTISASELIWDFFDAHPKP